MLTDADRRTLTNVQKLVRTLGDTPLAANFDALVEKMGHDTQGAPSLPAAEEYEYRTTTGPRKMWDQEPDLTKEGWELDVSQGREGWERFDNHEEMYWRRPRRPSTAQGQGATLSDDERWIAMIRRRAAIAQGRTMHCPGIRAALRTD